MFKKSVFALAVLFTAFMIASCGGSGNKDNKDNKDTIKKVVKVDTIKINKKYTDIAKFIAGIPVDENSELYELSQLPSFKKTELHVLCSLMSNLDVN